MKAHPWGEGQGNPWWHKDRAWGEGKGGGRDYSREKKDTMEGDNHRNHDHQAIVKPEDPAGPSRETL